jgi:hypothetical protein
VVSSTSQSKCLYSTAQCGVRCLLYGFSSNARLALVLPKANQIFSEDVTQCILKPYRRVGPSVASGPPSTARRLFLYKTLGGPMKSVTFSDLNTTRLTEPMLEHEVRLRAYERYQRRGKVDGHLWKTGSRPRPMYYRDSTGAIQSAPLFEPIKGGLLCQARPALRIFRFIRFLVAFPLGLWAFAPFCRGGEFFFGKVTARLNLAGGNRRPSS